MVVPEKPSTPSHASMTEFPPLVFPPPPAKSGQTILNSFFLYETKHRFYIVGTNAPAATKFRVLKIDRTTPRDELNITEDEGEYTKPEVDDLLEMIKHANKSTGGRRDITKFYGIVGFVRFTEGYYIILVTKRSPVALIGGHYVFHIEATMTISIHSSTTPTSKLDKNSDEARYLQMFQMVDLSKNFYFSYSYDITRTLQWNMSRNPQAEGRNRMFVWNQYLLENGFGESGIESQWALPIMYGFVDQSKLSILGRNVFITLIARRSRYFAGARFLKRGVNDRGYVANDVETEQIVSEMSVTSFYAAGALSANPNHTSFVQHRGSIPLYWTQDSTNMTPKPAIALNVIDPYFTAAAFHFDDMFKRYGAPCIVLNLIKAKEKTPRESILLSEFTDCIEYLNQFLPEDKKIWHIKWDMSRASKSPDENVISVLEIIAEKTFARTGFFHSGYSQDPEGKHKQNIPFGSGWQNGVVRTNCIDCLDRTNAAQFIIAKCALGHQLFSLGLISEPVVPFDCDAVNMLTEMYHDHGDTIALQYGGSHLVNTMETYRKINQWTSNSRDMIESIKRFYSNSFVDAEKQDAMNLFLGNYRVQKGVGPALWELPGDYHLHNTTVPELKSIRKCYIRWWSPDALLPQDVLARKSFQITHDHTYEYDSGYDYFPEYADEYNDGYVDDQYEPFMESDQNNTVGYDSTESGGLPDYQKIKAPQSELEGNLSGNTKQTSEKDSRIDTVNSTVGFSGSLQQEDESEPITQITKLDPTLSLLGSQGKRESLSSEQTSLQDEGLLDFSERVVPPLVMHVNPQISEESKPKSPSSSVLSMQRYQHPRLRASASRSSLSSSFIGYGDRSSSSALLSKGEKLVYDGVESCDNFNGDPVSIEWEEYWDEYYRPKALTSFQLLFAYNMTSTSRLMPSNIKNTSEQSPFEVRQIHNPPSQTEINAKAAAKSERRSMLGWLTGSSDKNKNAKAGSKTLPVSSGRRKGIISSLDDDPTFQEKGHSHEHKDGVARHARGSRLSITSFPSSITHEFDEKSATAAALRARDQQQGQVKKVRLPAHVPLSKEKVFELTKNVSTNLPKYAIHDTSFVPKSDKPSDLVDEKGASGAEDIHKDGASTVASTEVGAKGRSPMEEIVRRSLKSHVSPHELNEYKRYAKQFKSIRFDSVSTKGNASGQGRHKNSWLLGTPYNTTTATIPKHESFSSRTSPMQQDSSGDYVDSKYPNTSLSSFNSMPTTRPTLSRLQRGGSSTSTTTIGTTELNEEDEYYYAILRASTKRVEKPLQTDISTTSKINEKQTSNVFNDNGASNPSPTALSPLSAESSGQTTVISFPTDVDGSSSQPQQQQSECQHAEQGTEEEDRYNISDYLPDPPILLATPQVTIKPPSESEMILYHAHVELPKLTLYTVGQTSLNPYWGASSGTKARYDAYMMWIMKGRYGNAAPASNSTANQAGEGEAGANNGGGFSPNGHSIPTGVKARASINTGYGPSVKVANAI